MTRHFLRDDDLTVDERKAVLDKADAMKADRYGFRPLAGPLVVALIFDKPSSRTRISFSVGVHELGGVPLILDSHSTQSGRGESVEDTTRVLDRQVAAIGWRTFEQSDVERMAAVSRVPVINTLTDRFHPCQVLADLQTIRERTGKLGGLTFAYFGDGSNNMAHSYLLACADEGMRVRIASPERFSPEPDVLTRARELAAASGGSVELFADPKAAAYEADVLATDTWVSMGAKPIDTRDAVALRKFALDRELLDVADKGAFVMHCLPAYRGKEISAELLDGPRCVAWEQAENRLHVQKALLTYLFQSA